MGTAKHALPLGGRSMMSLVIEALEQVCRSVVVVGGPEAQVPDLRSGTGPLGGIESLLASGLDEQYLVCPCDVPLVRAELLQALTCAPARLITVLRIGGESEPRPLPMRIGAAALGCVRALLDSGRRAVRELLDEAQVIEAPAGWAPMLANVNTPQDYERMTRTMELL
jgi:molybdopterin-guanine dinucleotide biosynthesis protein A